jgi:hypothetical protein
LRQKSVLPFLARFRAGFFIACKSDVFPRYIFNASSTARQMLLDFERLLKYLAGLERLLKIYLRHFLCSSITAG